MIHVILVHGTFVPGARWTRHDSPFQLALRRTIDSDMTFSQVAWSGANSQAERDRGVARLKRAIDRQAIMHADVPIALVGHSHGGSVIAHFLKQAHANDWPIPNLVGSVFLSVPFYACRPHRRAIRVLPQVLGALCLTVAPALILPLIAPAIAVFASQVLFPLGNASFAAGITSILILAIVMFLLVLTFLSVLGGKVTRGIYRATWSRVARDCEAFQTCDLPQSGRYLFARVAGDEVASGLQWGVTAFRAIKLGWFLFAEPLRLLGSPLFHRRMPVWTKLILMLFLAGAFGFAGFIELLKFLQNPRELVPLNVAQLQLQILFEVTLLTVNSGIAGFILGLPIILAVLALNALVFLLFLSTAISLLGFAVSRPLGWQSFITSAFSDVNIEPTPFGRVEFVNLDWDWRQVGFDIAANHGRVYGDPALGAAVGQWLDPNRSHFTTGRPMDVSVPGVSLGRADGAGPDSAGSA